MKDSPYSSKNLKERKWEELHGLLVELKKEMFELRIMKSTSQLKDNNKIKFTRRNVAKVLTEINFRRKQK